MKTISKLIISAATLAALGTAAAFADDQQLQNRLALERQKAQRDQQTATVAIYAGGHGLSRGSAMQGDRSKMHFEQRWDAHGQFRGLYVPDAR